MYLNRKCQTIALTKWLEIICFSFICFNIVACSNTTTTDLLNISCEKGELLFQLEEKETSAITYRSVTLFFVNGATQKAVSCIGAFCDMPINSNRGDLPSFEKEIFFTPTGSAEWSILIDPLHFTISEYKNIKDCLGGHMLAIYQLLEKYPYPRSSRITRINMIAYVTRTTLDRSYSCETGKIEITPDGSISWKHLFSTDQLGQINPDGKSIEFKRLLVPARVKSRIASIDSCRDKKGKSILDHFAVGTGSVEHKAPEQSH